MSERGYTLLEVLFCVAALGLIVLAIVGLEHAALRSQKQANFPDTGRHVLTLMRSLAKDIHRAESIEAVESSRLVLKIDGARVEWNSGNHLVSRRRNALQQRWRLRKGIAFRAVLPSQTVELFFPGPVLYSYYSIQGGIR